jgi:tetratricopeptide (TPR) repeat protein
MSRNIKVAAWAEPPRASIIFVHGLGGHAYDTWRSAADDSSFWPLWLAEDLQGVAVYTLSYEAPPSNWLGTSMPLQDRAVNVLEGLIGSPGLTAGPVVFICHSLGGLIVKQMLLDLDRQKETRPEAAALLERVSQIVFMATPHTGSRQGSLLDRLRFLAWPSSIAKTLVANDPTLRAINVAYRGLADKRRGKLSHLVFYETRSTAAGTIVDEASADPGLAGRPPIPIDADHVKIVKPADRQSLQYARTRDFISENPARPDPEARCSALPLPVLRNEQPWNLVPKLMRIGLLVLVGLIAFKGIQALIAPAPVDTGQLEQKLDELKALMQQAVAQTTRPISPGTEQAVGEAIAGAAKGAAAGDDRLQKALDLLKQQKLGAAEAMFSQVAADRAARIRQDSKDAATAYRNLGAIAGLSDAKQALDAYTEAAKLDPADIESQYWIAWFQQETGNIPEAEATYREVLARVPPGDAGGYAHWSLLGLGDLDMRRGDATAALTHYRDGRAIIETLAAADPANATWQSDLAASQSKLGDVMVAESDLPAALKSYRDALAIAERLATADQANTDRQYELATLYGKLGIALQRTDDKQGALDALTRGRAILARSIARAPDAPLWQRDLAGFDRQIADLGAPQSPAPVR